MSLYTSVSLITVALDRPVIAHLSFGFWNTSVDSCALFTTALIGFLYLTYLLYHIFLIFSTNYLWALVIFIGAPLESRTPDTVIKSHVLYLLS